ncbi:hypothetical protein B9Z19DRAFT_810764 [Tuber borchii]|uniref:Uncharacterized protein n=1 Tax=Tuber borchii TaxID=42251 RepID=A0A2T6ZVU8_TUBBO|nr:hypothetical protein B9Z19DRAFT_810764 [Tuber borchii]
MGERFAMRMSPDQEVFEYRTERRGRGGCLVYRGTSAGHHARARGCGCGVAGSARAAGSRSGSHTEQRGGGCSRYSKSNSASHRYIERSHERGEVEGLWRR